MKNENDSGGREVNYVSVPAMRLSAGKALPGPVYICVGHHMVRYRNGDDQIDANEYNKLLFNKVRYVFVEERDRADFEAWLAAAEKAESVVDPALAAHPDASAIVEASMEQRRTMMDIFMNSKDDRLVIAAVGVSKRLVVEFMRKPFAVNNVQQLQKYAKGAVDHSANVSLLCVFLGLRMGYSHQLILENLALGGLFHDIGKTLVEPRADGAMVNEDDPAMQKHPVLGRDLLDTNKDISNEVKLMVAQHHEFLDGSGYPLRLKGLAVYDLARLVAIANAYDNLITESRKESMRDRCEEALERLGTGFEGKLDPKKLEKVIKILRYSFL